MARADRAAASARTHTHIRLDQSAANRRVAAAAAGRSLSRRRRANGVASGGAGLRRPDAESGTMSDIFQEVDEEVRREKAAQFWKKYQNLIFAGVALIVLATAGYRFYENRKLAAEQAAGAAYEQALAIERAGKDVDAEAAFARLAADAPGGYQTLARLASAGVRAKSDRDGALKAYDALAADSRRSARCSATPRACAPRCCASTPARRTPPSRPWRRWRGRRPLSQHRSPRSRRHRARRRAITRAPANGSTSSSPIDGAPEVEKKSAQSLLGLVAANRPAAK